MAEIRPPIVPEYLYRYRSLTRQGAMDQEISAIAGKYLYCANFAAMNDPMEGFYSAVKRTRDRTYAEQFADEVVAKKEMLGIASLTESYDDVLMWTHYAGNYGGICVEYRSDALVEGLAPHVKLVRMAYVDHPPHIDTTDEPEKAAVSILSQKKWNWSYEREWRVLAPIGPAAIQANDDRRPIVTGIYFGSRLEEQVCRDIRGRLGDSRIKAYAMEVDGYKHRWTDFF